MKKVSALIIASLFILSMLAGCTGNQSQPSGQAENPPDGKYEPLEFGYATASGKGSVIYDSVYRFQKMIEERSDGAVKVKVYDSGVLGSQKELTESVNNGTIQMAYSTSSLLSTYLPEIAVFSLPFIFLDDVQAQKAVNTSGVAELLRDKLLEGTNIRVLTFLAGGARDMMTNGVPIKSLSDFKGVKFRSPEAFEYTKMFEALGATPTPMPFTEMYQAVKTKLVDGLETNASAMVTDKYYEVGTHVMQTKHINTVEAVVINEVFWKSLPKATQELIQECAKEAAELEFKDRMELAKNAVDELKKLGLTVIELDTAELSQACQVVYDEFIAKNPDAAKLIDILKTAR